MIAYGEMRFFISVGTLEFGHVNIILEYEFSVMMIKGNSFIHLSKSQLRHIMLDTEIDLRCEQL